MKAQLEHARAEDGFTMGVVLIAAFIVTIVATVALGAATGDLNGNRNSLDQKQAYDAAQAGINDYAFHLNNDNSYWAKCDGVPIPNAVNQIGSTLKRRAVPGSTTASYAIELVPATGQTSCKTNDPIGSMIEPNGPMGGTFRIRSTGYAGNEKRSIVTTFKRTSFLDYVYFTQYETSDPVTYGDPDISRRGERRVREVAARGPAQPRRRHSLLQHHHLPRLRLHQGPAAHQRLARDLRQPDVRARPRRRDRGQRAAAGMAETERRLRPARRTSRAPTPPTPRCSRRRRRTASSRTSYSRLVSSRAR